MPASTVRFALATATATALAAAPSAAHADVDVRLPFDFTGAHNFMGMGVVGIGVDLGQRVSPDFYLGVQGDYELVIDAGGENPDVTPSLLHRMRAGGEVRYYVADGLAEMTSGGCECGCAPTTTLVNRKMWIGVAAGAETIDGGTHLGRYATGTIGFDFASPDGSGTRFGFYLSGEVSRERSQDLPSVAGGDWDPLAVLSTGTATTNVPTSDDTTTAVGAIMGMRIGF